VFKKNCGKPKEIGGQQKKRLLKKIVGTKIKWGKQKNCGKQKKRLKKIVGNQKKKLWEKNNDAHFPLGFLKVLYLLLILSVIK
jgi:hypothetical protein